MSGLGLFGSGLVRRPHLRQPEAWKKTSGSVLLQLSGPVVYGRTTFSIRAGKAEFSRSGLRLSTDDKFHSRPGEPVTRGGLPS